jgi:hypothetical protein
MTIIMDQFEFDLRSKLRGYFTFPREMILKLFYGESTISTADPRPILTANQFAQLIIYIAMASWDRRNRKKYAIAEISDRKLSKIVGFKKDKVGLNRKILETKGYIDLLKGTNRSFNIKIKNPELFYPKLTDKVSDKVPTLSDKDDTHQV